MRRSMHILVALALVAASCEVGALCMMAQSEGDSGVRHCCCPVAEGQPAPCLEQDSDQPAVPTSEATPSSQPFAATLATAPGFVAATQGHGAPPVACAGDPAAAHRPAAFLLACRFLI